MYNCHRFNETIVDGEPFNGKYNQTFRLIWKLEMPCINKKAKIV